MTGATGNVGSAVLARLLGAGVGVRAVSRRPERVPVGVEVVRGDQFDPDVVREAADGTDAAFLVWPAFSADGAREVVAALAAGTSRVVFLSSGAVDDSRDVQESVIGQFHADVEGALVESGVEWTFLRPHGFATNTLAWLPDILAGDEVRGGFGDVALTLVHEDDIAAVAVKALVEDGHLGAKYVLTGPELLTRAEQVRLIGEALGRPLRWVELSPEAELEAARRWLPEALAEAFVGGLAARVGDPVPPTRTVEDVTGSPARTFRQWLADHVDDFVRRSA
ncbi:NAD(P)H-binding protein [Saccharothrix sp. CCNWLW140]|uniref:NAD(P)H-binding protein n=1 Tax=Saccharothrix sp. CCNWLW140 TaxID=3128895 RepID=UPI00307EDF66